MKIFDVTLCFQSPARPRASRRPAAPPQTSSAAGGRRMGMHAGKKRGAEKPPRQVSAEQKGEKRGNMQKVRSLQIRSGDADGVAPAAAIA